jgi:hypothetical protein
MDLQAPNQLGLTNVCFNPAREDLDMNGFAILNATGGGSGGIQTITGTINQIVATTDIDGNATIGLANTAVSVGTYTNATVSVDAFGRITSAESGTLPGAETLAETLSAGNSAGSFDINLNNNRLQNCLGINASGSLIINAPINTLITAGNSIELSALNIDFNNANTLNVPSPATLSSAVNKAYVDTLPVPTLAQVLTSGNQADANINMNGFDISAVNDITMSGLVPSITATNIAGNLVVSSAGTMNIATAGLMTLASGGVLNIGSADYTSIENLKITNSVVEKVEGTADLTYLNVGSVSNANANVEINSGLQVRPNGDVMINTNTPEAKLTVNGSVNIYSTTNGDGMYFSPATDGDFVVGLTPTSVFSVSETSIPTTNPSVLAEFQDTNRGITIPTMTQVQREAIASPAIGLLVFDTTASAIYMYGSSGWAKCALTNSNNELLQSLSGLSSGTRTHSLSGLTEVDTASLKTQAISVLDVLVDPVIYITGDLALDPNATISFGEGSSGDGTITATNAIHLNASQVDTTATFLLLNGQYTTLSGDSITLNPSLETNLQGETRTSGNLTVEGKIIDSTASSGVNGYVLTSTGNNVRWLPASGGGGVVESVVGGTNISVNSTDPANPIVSLDTSTGINMNNTNIDNVAILDTQVIINSNGTVVAFDEDVQFNEGIRDEDNSLGEEGQVLSSIYDGINKGVRWIDPPDNLTFTAGTNITVSKVGNNVSIGFTASPSLNLASNSIRNAPFVNAPTGSNVAVRASGSNSAQLTNSDLLTPLLSVAKSGIVINPWDGGTGTVSGISVISSGATFSVPGKFMTGIQNHLGEYGTAGQVLTSGGSSQPFTWTTLPAFSSGLLGV